MRKSGQNLVEFAAIIPLLVFLIFSIIEFSMYWTTVNAVQGMAQTASTKMASVYVSEASTANPAVVQALSSIIENSNFLGEELIFTDISTDTSTRPFAVYQYQSVELRNTDAGEKPVMKVTIDYRDPYKDGITLQLSYRYRTILLGASLPLPGTDPLVIIPSGFEIISKRNQQYRSY
ncbi:MAG: TadE/TadG family type IV pilus assembly protein [Candidatus Gastranaerophilales bacterium]|nr:TadE/TadG family type IV pilus assembly protein [Candidatus Gastranaerophilales bacterium]